MSFSRVHVCDAQPREARGLVCSKQFVATKPSFAKGAGTRKIFLFFSMWQKSKQTFGRKDVEKSHCAYVKAHVASIISWICGWQTLVFFFCCRLLSNSSLSLFVDWVCFWWSDDLLESQSHGWMKSGKSGSKWDVISQPSLRLRTLGCQIELWNRCRSQNNPNTQKKMSKMRPKIFNGKRLKDIL